MGPGHGFARIAAETGSRARRRDGVDLYQPSMNSTNDRYGLDVGLEGGQSCNSHSSVVKKPSQSANAIDVYSGSPGRSAGSRALALSEGHAESVDDELGGWADASPFVQPTTRRLRASTTTATLSREAARSA